MNFFLKKFSCLRYKNWVHLNLIGKLTWNLYILKKLIQDWDMLSCDDQDLPFDIINFFFYY